jgi:hypothetical protein
VQAENTSTEEKLKLISQTIEHYRQEIEELKEKLTPTTPPEVREQRKQEAALQLAELEKHVSTTEELFDRVMQLWTMLEEDEQVQQWDQEEERDLLERKKIGKLWGSYHKFHLAHPILIRPVAL